MATTIEITGTTTTPQRFATYPGDATTMATRNQVVGPNTLGEYLTAITAHYNPHTGTTRVGFIYGADGPEKTARILANTTNTHTRKD